MSCSPTFNLWLYTGCPSYHKVKAGYTLDKVPVRHETERKTSIHTHTYQQLRAANYPNLHVFRSWKEAGIPREDAQRRRESAQTQHRKSESNQEPSCCEATVLTTAPSCHSDDSSFTNSFYTCISLYTEGTVNSCWTGRSSCSCTTCRPHQWVIIQCCCWESLL